ncbi:multidrug transporter [Lodderomyces elongisporus]|uniref:multidrug transporter n=1 Tax=Lodderomyces elongisporus TaxID=36914 RepID=UPI002921D5BB|nr:multidrug transporter [Lodderomyces elongisporus]WLF80826.1 multidrug transporter [Lodderomyces elongisporus]
MATNNTQVNINERAVQNRSSQDDFGRQDLQNGSIAPGTATCNGNQDMDLNHSDANDSQNNYTSRTRNNSAQTSSTISPSSRRASDQEFNESPNQHPDETSHHEKYYEADAGDGTKAHEQYLHGLPLFLTLISCIISLFIVALDQTIVSTILTTVGDQFNSFEKVGWLTSGFMLPMACLVPSYGKISIAFGRKVTLIVGIIIFEIGSLISALSNSMSLLIGGRVIQGIGGGAVQSMVMVILTESVPISRRSLAFACVAVVWSTSSVLGPIIGGALEKVSWRWCFYINLPIGGFSLIVLMLGFHPPRAQGNIREKLKKIDYMGTFLVTSGIVLVLLAMTFGGVDFAWNSAAIICLFVIGGVLCILFLVWNFGFSSNPIIMKEFVKSPAIMAAVISAMFNFAFFIANLTYLAIYFQVIFDASSLQSGIDLLPLLITVTVTSCCNSLFLNVMKNVKLTMILSGVLSPIGTGLFLLLGRNSSLGLRIGIMIVSGISIGLQFQSSLLSAQLVAPKDIPGALIMVTVFVNFMKSLASTISVTIAQLLFQTTGATYIKDLQNTLSQDTPGYEQFKQIPSETLISNPRSVKNLSSEIQDQVLDQFVKALKNVFYFGLALAVVCFFASFCTTNKKIPKNKDIKTKESGDEEDDKEEEEDKGEDKGNREGDGEGNVESKEMKKRVESNRSVDASASPSMSAESKSDVENSEEEVRMETNKDSANA